MIEFVKLHGAGNDYIAIDGRGVDRDWGALSAAMSRLNFGVGGDGIVLVQPSERAQVRMRVFNPDGSEAEMSGNGIRLFAKFVIDRKIALPGRDGLIVETGGGIRTVWPEIQNGQDGFGKGRHGRTGVRARRHSGVEPRGGWQESGRRPLNRGCRPFDPGYVPVGRQSTRGVICGRAGGRIPTARNRPVGRESC